MCSAFRISHRLKRSKKDLFKPKNAIIFHSIGYRIDFEMDHRGTFLTTIREIHGQGFPKLRARSMPDVRTSSDKVNQYWDFGGAPC